MCLVTFAVGGHQRYPFVLVANRDERYERPTAGLHFWDDQPDVLAGRDLDHGGTWLGLTRAGRFATLTNHPFTEWQPHEPVSRGSLVSDFLKGDHSAEAYLDVLRASRQRYEGYHLIFGSLEGGLWVYSNVEDCVERYAHGLHSVGNTYDDLTMHKEMRSLGLLAGYLGMAVSVGVIGGEQETQNLADGGLASGDTTDTFTTHREVLDPDELLEIFQDSVPASNLTIIPEQLPLEVARNNSSIFIKGDYFGTVGSTVILVDRDGWVHAKEVRYNQEDMIEISEKQFKLGPSEQSVRPHGQVTNEVNE